MCASSCTQNTSGEPLFLHDNSCLAKSAQETLGALCMLTTAFVALETLCLVQVLPYYSSNPPRLNTAQLAKFAQETLLPMS